MLTKKKAVVIHNLIKLHDTKKCFRAEDKKEKYTITHKQKI